jgi:pentatricopeptide repeat protein
MITAYGDGGQWQRAERLFSDMQSNGLQPNDITYNAMITAYGSSGEWQKAEQLYEQLQSTELIPDVLTHNSMFSAYGRGSQWQKAEHLFLQLPSKGFNARLQDYNIMMTAYSSGNQWQLALELLSQLQQTGLTPDLVTYGTLIDIIQRAEQTAIADELYRRLITEKHIAHWHKRELYTLDFHNFNSGMAVAAMRLVLCNMKAATDDNNKTTARHSDTYVHDAKRDLRIVTGHAMKRDHGSGSTLQPCITDMLQQLGISCHVDLKNKGMLVVPSQQLLAYCSREATTSVTKSTPVSP